MEKEKAEQLARFAEESRAFDEGSSEDLDKGSGETSDENEDSSDESSDDNEDSSDEDSPSEEEEAR